MSPSERYEKRRVKESIKSSLTLDEEARLTEGEYIRREKPIGERSHLQQMLKYLQEQEEQAANSSRCKK